MMDRLSVEKSRCCAWWSVTYRPGARVTVGTDRTVWAECDRLKAVRWLSGVAAQAQ